MLLEILRNPGTSIPYAALTALKQHSRAPFLLETAESDFDWQNYAHAGHCECTPKQEHLEEAVYTWAQTADKPYRTVMNGYFDVRWEGHALELLQIQYESSCGMTNRVWVGAEDQSAAQTFFAAVCRWSTTIREEVYVYQEGFWTKDAELYKSIQSSRLDNLILPPGLKEAIRTTRRRTSTRASATAGSTSPGSAA